MHLTTIIISATLAFATGTNGWAPDGKGNQVANKTDYVLDGKVVDEACTDFDTNEIVTSGPCKYWADGNGGITEGTCSEARHEIDGGGGSEATFIRCN
ncbi:uncharacterized protein B0H64DRAFT_100529 [Chaetomium fimeti]|uniref:Uncharacterized protein n=1 Tax=Chaetomium fimeti TaxID=1854472 RepID=A0AAE0LVT2_9PEZI|nr:hypothetical protein B0H64DRAFT_100529 [Chaetomium fimeti]